MAGRQAKRKGIARNASLEERWRGLIGRWRAGGGGVREFCAAEDVPESAFYYWRQELARRDSERKSLGQSSGAFVPVRLAGGLVAPVELELGSGRVLRLGAGFEPGKVAELVRLLEA